MWKGQTSRLHGDAITGRLVVLVSVLSSFPLQTRPLSFGELHFPGATATQSVIDLRSVKNGNQLNPVRGMIYSTARTSEFFPHLAPPSLMCNRAVVSEPKTISQVTGRPSYGPLRSWRFTESCHFGRVSYPANLPSRVNCNWRTL